MTTEQSIILGIIQGLSEFLPVSSSGHLRLLENWMGFVAPQTMFDVSMHLATLLVVLLYFRQDVWEIIQGTINGLTVMLSTRKVKEAWTVDGFRGFIFVVVGSLPTGLIGYFFGETLEQASGSMKFLAAMFICNGLFLIATRVVRLPVTTTRLNKGFGGMVLSDAILIGCIQGLAVTRGISRSGTTIGLGLMLGMDRNTGAKFSFLLSVPAICGAVALELTKAVQSAVKIDWAVIGTGSLAAFLSGFLALAVLMKIVTQGKLHRFGWYTLVLGLLVAALALLSV